MNKSTSFTIITSLTLILGLAGAIALVRNSQDTRSSASFSSGSLALLPDENTKKINEDFVIKIKSQNNTTANITAFQTVLCYESSKISVNKDSVKFNSGFVRATVSDLTVGGKNCIGIAGYLEKSEGINGINLDLADVTFRGLEVGTGEITVESSKTKVAGVNPSGGDDNEIAVTVANAKYSITTAETITPTVGPTQAPGVTPTVAPTQTPINPSTKRIKVKLTSQDALASESNCFREMPLSVVVLSKGVKTAVLGVKAVKNNESVDGLAVFEAEIPLTSVNLPSNDIAIFIKGPSHLQMKYAVNNQGSVYDKAGGELSIDNDASTVTEFNFTKVSMMTGDIVGNIANSTSLQNGVIDAIDYSYIKDEANKETVSDSYMKADLDGSCKANNRDVTTFLKSLRDKQDQLY